MKVKLKKGADAKYLDHGVHYTVYAIYLAKVVELMVWTDSLPSAPHAVPLESVEVVDGRLSKYWIASELGASVKAIPVEIISFPEWANSNDFYQKILDGHEEAGIWRSYKEKIDAEYADSSEVHHVATALSGGWMQCSECSNAWQPERGAEVLRCPTCKLLQRSA